LILSLAPGLSAVVEADLVCVVVVEVLLLLDAGVVLVWALTVKEMTLAMNNAVIVFRTFILYWF
jgi:hypothetical protein